ncbi:condensation domain-containing protein [Streptomyces huasconensis]|uniref:Condensation domain-containing protein n=1 Tax=Streptomyces huasconensis TaxID=1854574 RepID=A0ABV3LT27_9ACTN
MTVDGIDPTAKTLPLGPLQEGIWLFWRLNPTSPAYSMLEIFHFDGAFSLTALESAFHGLLRRHEALRTTFRDTETGVVQVVSRDPLPVPVEVVDLRGLAQDARSERLQSAIGTAANRPFDLLTEPGIRLTAIQVSDSRTTLVLVAHHIVCDGLSMGVLLDEFGELYRSARRGTEPGLGPVPPGYSAFVEGQLAALDDGTLEEETAYWREQLAGTTGSVLPGADRTGTRTPVARDTAMVTVTLDEAQHESLSSCARNTRSTPFAVLLSAMKVMIAAATGESVTALGMATSGRTPEFDRTVGVFANTIVVRSQIDLSRTFTDTLKEVSLDLMDAIDHQDLPFSRMVADAEAEQQPGAGILQTVFTAGAVGSLKLDEGEMTEVYARTVQGPFDLHVACDITPAGIALDWEYARRTYPDDVAHGYAAAYQDILVALLAQPDAPMTSFGLHDLLARVPGRAEDGAATDGSASPAQGERDLSADRVPAEGAPAFTDVEKAIAAIWADVLGVPVESPYDDFFELGGHSLLVGPITAAVRQQVSQSATLRLLFEHPQLRDFASQLDADTVAAGG